MARQLTRRQALAAVPAGATLLIGAATFAGGRVAAAFEFRGSRLGELAQQHHRAEVSLLRSRDRDGAFWRRTEGEPPVEGRLKFRSVDRYLPDGRHDAADGGWWMIDEPVLSAAQAGATAGGRQDSSQAIQAVLDTAAKLGRPVDDQGRQYRIARSIILPRGVVWSNVRLQAIQAGIDVVRISSDSQFLDFEITGTGAVSRARNSGAGEINERAIYPAADGISGAVVRGIVKNTTIGVHLQPLNPRGVAPSRCTISVQLTNIVGRAGVSEGYGVLLSPANDCVVDVVAETIQRHAVYLSAGASRNKVTASVSGCLQDAVTIYATANQPYCEDNTLDVFAKGVRQSDAPGVQQVPSCLSIYGKARNNRVVVHAFGAESSADVASAPYAAVLVKGAESTAGPFPQNNTVQVIAQGYYRGPYVAASSDAIETSFIDCQIDGRGTVGIIGFTDSRPNKRRIDVSGRVINGRMDGRDDQGSGILIGTSNGAVVIGDGISISRVSRPTADYTGMARSSRSSGG